MSASDQSSYMLFLRNEFSKIFEEFFTMTEFTKITHTPNDESKIKEKDLKLSFLTF